METEWGDVSISQVAVFCGKVNELMMGYFLDVWTNILRL